MAAAAFFAVARDLTRRRPPRTVLFGVRTIAVSVLEIDPEILDRLARQLFDQPRVEAVRRPRVRSPTQPPASRRRRVLVERPQGHRAQLLRRIGGEEMRAAVDGVHGLARGRIAGIAIGNGLVGCGQRRCEFVQRRGCEACLRHGRNAGADGVSVLSVESEA